MVLEIIIIKFSFILKMMSRNTFPEPQPDSALYLKIFFFFIGKQIKSALVEKSMTDCTLSFVGGMGQSQTWRLSTHPWRLTTNT